MERMTDTEYAQLVEHMRDQYASTAPKEAVATTEDVAVPQTTTEVVPPTIPEDDKIVGIVEPKKSKKSKKRPVEEKYAADEW